MSRLVAAFAVVSGVVILPGCIEGFDTLNGSDEAYYRLFDYVIDRPRVLAVTYWPPAPGAGEEVTFVALAATPEDPVSPEVTWWACGISLDVPFVYHGADCMETSLAELVGTGQSLTVRLPYYDVSGCAPSGGCFGYIPVVATVADPDGEETGQGITFLSPDFLDRYPYPELDQNTWNAMIQLRIDGNEGSATARPGSEVVLEATVLSEEPDREFSWYTTAGTFTEYGVTVARADWSFQGDGLHVVLGRNTLVVPKESPPDSIQVYVVSIPLDAYHPSLTRFASGTIEVVR